MQNIEILQANIVTLKVDAIVNAANSSLLGGGGVDGAIHQAAGPELLAECKTLNGCPTGEAKITQGYNLAAKYVIHTVGPIWHGGNNNEPNLLANCYKNSLALAATHKIKTIAFPAISCGVYGYPIDAAVPLAIKTVYQHLQKNKHTLDKVYFTCYGEDILQAYVKSFASFFKE
ncbi:MAG: O-acetyl-ADP-ribose deacetylase [Pseudomonadota bacterium]